MSNCAFCDIVAGEAPSSIIYEDSNFLAILTLRPMNRGHSLVIPKEHIDSLSGLSEQMGGHLFKIAMRIAGALRSSDIKCDGVNFWLADGPIAGQEVFHVHLHVLPRFEQDDIRLEANRLDPSRTEMDSTAKQIRSVFNSN